MYTNNPFILTEIFGQISEIFPYFLSHVAFYGLIKLAYTGSFRTTTVFVALEQKLAKMYMNNPSILTETLCEISEKSKIFRHFLSHVAYYVLIKLA